MRGRYIDEDYDEDALILATRMRIMRILKMVNVEITFGLLLSLDL
jgi:hypothetical protein